MALTYNGGTPAAAGPPYDGGDQDDVTPEWDAGGVREVASTVVTQWTSDWWDLLPAAYRSSDAVQNLESGGYPMRRWMDGAGSIAHEIRQVVVGMYDGTYTDPDRIDDRNLGWLAQMLGAPQAQRRLPPLELRRYLSDIKASGLAPVGTRRAIYEVAKYFLQGTRQVNVLPSTTPHRIVLLVRADEIPGDNDAAVAEGVMASGAVPAGHDVVVQRVFSSWDSWSAAAGVSWDEKEQRIRTWSESDSAGVQIE